MDELYPLLKRQAKLYTMGDSDSLPAETAAELLRSICFSIETGLFLSGNPAGGQPLEALFEEGNRAVWQLTEEAKLFFDTVKNTVQDYGSVAYRDTLKALEAFFRAYDLRFFAHEVPCMIDYPLCLPVPEALAGVRYVGEYLRRLMIENRFCRCFKRESVVSLLLAHHSEYRELILNLFEPIFACALGLALLHRNAASLRLNAADCDRLYELFRPWDEARSNTFFRESLNRLLTELKLRDTELRSYLAKAAEQFAPMLKAASREGYYNLFVAV
uniref:Uncharacterized protein n=1 Tax=termite gut metagenome TaxID=433724 RepID=S0DFZ9_9ZZZZ